MRKACPGGSPARSAKSARLLVRPQRAGPSGSQASGSTNLPNSSFLGGELPGGVKVKLGDKVISLRGNVGVGDNGDNFKAGVGLPF